MHQSKFLVPRNSQYVKLPLMVVLSTSTFSLPALVKTTFSLKKIKSFFTHLMSLSKIFSISASAVSLAVSWFLSNSSFICTPLSLITLSKYRDSLSTSTGRGGSFTTDFFFAPHLFMTLFPYPLLFIPPWVLPLLDTCDEGL